MYIVFVFFIAFVIVNCVFVVVCMVLIAIVFDGFFIKCNLNIRKIKQILKFIILYETI